MLEKKWGERPNGCAGSFWAWQQTQVEDEITYLKHVVLWPQCRGFSAVFGCVIITTKAETPTSGAKSCTSVPDTIQIHPIKSPSLGSLTWAQNSTHVPQKTNELSTRYDCATIVYRHLRQTLSRATHSSHHCGTLSSLQTRQTPKLGYELGGNSL